ncbi:thiamine phosphate synthase [Neobacillus sp. SM06]|uniref:thiamine phosphate synthase n=1 Tax=Neobacillus sp. SM06 TaxID=3422492 RepID=UPI003D2B33B4
MSTYDQERLRSILKVYFIAGSPNCTKNPKEVLQEAIAGGITLFQFREKGKGALTGEAKFMLANELQQICRNHGVPFIVNDDVELALRLDADGVHIGQEDEPVETVRSKIGDKILGVSAHTLEEVHAAIEQGADYLGIGPIFPTSTKEDVKPVQGTTFIRELRRKGIDIPLVGIGGINSENASVVMEAGADGVSVITAISLATNIHEAAKQLKNQVL